jgi:DNA-binding transcriptional LysR family regulator
MLEIRRLRLLRELAQRGTLTAVADALSYSPSTVSQQLSQLEAEVGVPLLEPDGRRVRLTPQAHILIGHTERILEHLEQAEADIAASTRDLVGEVRVAAFQTAALSLVPAAIRRLVDVHPGLVVRVAQAEPEHALPALLAREFDLVVAEEYPGNPRSRLNGLETQELLDDPIRLAHPRSVPTPRSARALAQLADHPWVMEPTGSAARTWAVALCRTAGFEPDVRYESSDLVLHTRLVEAGLAAALLPDLARGIRRPTVAIRSLPKEQAHRRLYTATRAGHTDHPAIHAVRAAFTAAIPHQPR